MSPSALPGYAALSLLRVGLSTVLAVVFAIAFGRWTAHDPIAERFVTPILDQTRRNLPAAGFLPLLAMGLMSVFPHGNIGLEIAAVLALFLTQMWALASGFRNALKAVPPQLIEMAKAFHFRAGRRFRHVELPFGANGLVWNAMLGMARGWFILIAAETLVQGTRDFRLPGLGSYLSAAVQQDRPDAIVLVLATMAGIALGLYVLLWRPLLVWTQQFRFDEECAMDAETSFLLTWFQQSRLGRFLHRVRKRLRHRKSVPFAKTVLKTAARWKEHWPARLSATVLILAAVPLVYGLVQLGLLLLDVSPRQWADLVVAAAFTFGRVVLTLLLATLWALPVGVVIGLSPRLARWGEPAVLVAASFPATLLFPLFAVAFARAGVSHGWGCVILMLLAAQWYVLFNVLAAATVVPADLREAAVCFRLTWWRRFWTFQVPAVFPSLVAGWDTAAGLAWNTSLVVEAMTVGGELIPVRGLGYEISRATQHGNFAVAAAGFVVLAIILQLISRYVWRRLNGSRANAIQLGADRPSRKRERRLNRRLRFRLGSASRLDESHREQLPGQARRATATEPASAAARRRLPPRIAPEPAAALLQLPPPTSTSPVRASRRARLGTACSSLPRSWRDSSRSLLSGRAVKPGR